MRSLVVEAYGVVFGFTHVNAAKHGVARVYPAVLRPVLPVADLTSTPGTHLQRDLLTIGGPVLVSGPSAPPHLATPTPGSWMTGARSHTRSGDHSPDSEDYEEGNGLHDCISFAVRVVDSPE